MDPDLPFAADLFIDLAHSNMASGDNVAASWKLLSGDRLVDVNKGSFR